MREPEDISHDGGSEATIQPLLASQPRLLSTSSPRPQAPTESSQARKRGEKSTGTHSKFFNRWGLEVSALAVSLLAFALTIWLLLQSNGQPITKWTKLFISLNAAVSILAGTARACLAFSISMCLSQGKWNWMSQSPQPLIDFDRFDAASRGAWGSLRLLQSFKRRPHWVAMGALAAIALLAFEPFIQAVLTLENKAISLDDQEYSVIARARNDSVGSTPSIGRSTRLDGAFWHGLNQTPLWLNTHNFTGPDNETLVYTYSLTSRDIQKEIGLQSATWTGFSPLTVAQNLRPAFACASGNCSWTNFASIAVCSECHDLSHHVTNVSGPIKLPSSWNDGQWVPSHGESLPDVSNVNPHGVLHHTNVSRTKYEIPELHLNLSNYDGQPQCVEPESRLCPDTHLSVRVTTNKEQTIGFRNLSTLVMAVQYLVASETWRNNITTWENTRVASHECALSFCVNEYQDVLSQGVLSEKIVSSWSNRSSGSYSSHWEPVNAFLRNRNHSLDMEGMLSNLSDLQIEIPEEHRRRLNLSERTFNITQPTISALLDVLHDGFGSYYVDPREGRAQRTLPVNYLTYPTSGLDRPPGLMVGLGGSKDIPMTMENVALSLTKWIRDRDFETSPVRGSATMDIIITRVRWHFIIVPVVSYVMGLAFVIACMWETERLGRPALKGSILAVLACAPDDDLRSSLKQAAAEDALPRLGRKKNVLLVKYEGIGQLRQAEGPLNV